MEVTAGVVDEVRMARVTVGVPERVPLTWMTETETETEVDVVVATTTEVEVAAVVDGAAVGD